MTHFGRTALGAFLLGAMLASRAEAAPIDLVRFGDGAAETAQLAAAEALVFDDEGKAQFVAGAAFLIGQAGGPLHAHEWDVARGLVRISRNGAPGLWIACDSLRPMAIACSTSFDLVSDGILIVGRGVEAAGGGAKSFSQGEKGDGPRAGLPRCPGDPRCPGAR